MPKAFRIGSAFVVSMIGLVSLGCSGDVQLQLRDAAVSGAATFIEQQTLQLLTSVFDTGGGQ